MNQEQKQVMEKVKKLLALSQSPSEGEAAAAVQKAQVLLAKYGLSISEIKEETNVLEDILLEKKRLRKWESSLIFFVGKATFTEALEVKRGDTKKIMIIGKEVNIISAKELFGYLHSVVLILGRKHSSEVYHVESFKQGVVHRVGERLEAQRNTDTYTDEKAIVLKMDSISKKENFDYMKNKYGTIRQKSKNMRLDADSYYYGKNVGDSINLSQQLE